MAGTNPPPDPGPDRGRSVGEESQSVDSALGAADGTGVGPGEGPGPADTGTAAEPPDRTWTVLIAALGGEGGGVLSSWLVDAASMDGRRVQATSVPGVAQRTGATTYYLEIGPRFDEDGSREGSDRGLPGADSGNGALRSGPGPNPDAPPGARGQVMALLPTPGNVDLLVASELLEAGRAAQNGMITPDRTTVIASTHRMFAIAEKSAMGDGRFNDERVRRAVSELSRRHVLTDLGKVAERAGTVLSSVLLGAIAGSGALPIARERLRGAIDRAGIAVEANLRGFDAGCRLFDDEASPHPDSRPAVDPERGQPAATSAAAGHRPSALAARVDALPAPLREFAGRGLERAVDYQDARYGALYLDRIEGLLERTASKRHAGPGSRGTEAAAPASPGGPAAGGNGRANHATGEEPAAHHAVAREAARELALWMCFEDLIRVADLKTRRSRIERVRAEVRAKPGQPVAITEFLKPGVDEWCSVLPGWLARPILRAADRGGWRRRLNVGLHVRTSSVSGFLLLWTLARLKGLRRGMHRYREEQERIEAWLGHVADAYATSPALALETAKCANLVKGYGDTHERGVRNFERTMAAIAACRSAPEPAASLRALREAALADPEGTKLDDAIAALAGAPSRAESH